MLMSDGLEWFEVKVEREEGEGVTVAAFRWNAYDDLWIRLADGSVHKSHDQGETWELIKVSWYRTVTWGWRLKSWWWASRIRRMGIRLRYILTGDCGQNCHMGQVSRSAESDEPEWTAVYWTEYRLIPEADCPVHDNDIMNREE